MENKTRYHLNRCYISDPRRFGEILLIQIGRRYCSPTAVIDPHPHLDWFELTIVTGGSGTVITNGERSTVRAGDIYLSFPCDIHEIRADCGVELDYDFFAFRIDGDELRGELERIMQGYRSGERRIIRDEKISALTVNAISEFSGTALPRSELVVTNLFSLIVSYLIRDFNDTPRTTAEVSEASILCYQLMNYIDTHIYEVNSLASLAPKFNYNYRYLSGLFRRTTGKTLSEYLRARRLETAKVMVLENEKRISEIAEMFGYTPYSFSKAFKERFGISPKAMRK